MVVIEALYSYGLRRVPGQSNPLRPGAASVFRGKNES
jgi:hypothetical protein